MEDEISLDQRYPSNEVSRQEKLIIKYFGDIDARIRKAASRRHALTIGSEVLEAFECECISEILPDLLRHYVAELVGKYWPEKET